MRQIVRASERQSDRVSERQSANRNPAERASDAEQRPDSADACREAAKTLAGRGAYAVWRGQTSKQNSAERASDADAAGVSAGKRQRHLPATVRRSDVPMFGRSDVLTL